MSETIVKPPFDTSAFDVLHAAVANANHVDEEKLAESFRSLSGLLEGDEKESFTFEDFRYNVFNNRIGRATLTGFPGGFNTLANSDTGENEYILKFRIASVEGGDKRLIDAIMKAGGEIVEVIIDQAAKYVIDWIRQNRYKAEIDLISVGKRFKVVDVRSKHTLSATVSSVWGTQCVVFIGQKPWELMVGHNDCPEEITGPGQLRAMIRVTGGQGHEIFGGWSVSARIFVNVDGKQIGIAAKDGYEDRYSEWWHGPWNYPANRP